MIWFEHTADDLATNLAIDESLLLLAEETDAFECLRFWEWPQHAVVLGAGGSVEIDVHRQACEFENVPIKRRSSGGGTVLLGQGCLLFSLVLSHRRATEIRDVNASYRWILSRVCSALSDLGLVTIAGTSDLAIDCVKFSGNAQQRKSRSILHHGTLLYDFDLSCVPRFLKPPERMPAYRAGREHREFVRNIPVSRESLIGRLTRAFEVPLGNFPTGVIERAEQLRLEKYDLDEWNFRR